MQEEEVVKLFKRQNRSKYVLAENYNILMESIKKFETDPSILTETKDGEFKFRQFLKELLRLFHNYTASVISHRDHTYQLKNKLDNEQLNEEYNIELEKRNIPKKTSFIQDLRNFTLHRSLPLVDIEGQFSSGQEGAPKVIGKQKLLLKKERLLLWDKWSAESKKYIENSKDKINLKTECTKYQTTIEDFDDWFWQKLEELYPVAMKKFKQTGIRQVKIDFS